VRQVGFTLLSRELRECTSRKAKRVLCLGARRVGNAWQLCSKNYEKKFSIMRWMKNSFFIRDCWGDLAGIVREVWGSTRGTPMPCHWFMGFVERQAPRSYRMVVLG